MKVQESCNDTHLIEIKLDAIDILSLKNGKIAHIECKKSENTEIIIHMGEDK